MRVPAEVTKESGEKGPRLSALTMVLLALVAASALAMAGWKASGGGVSYMTTPSMCPAVCVGSLVATEPLNGPVHVGELLSFHPPGSAEVFTHRVHAVGPNGTFRTKGDANQSADPWVLSSSNVVGKVAFTWWGVGWWLRGLPFLAVGSLFLLLVRPLVKARHRRSWERIFAVLIIAVPMIVLRPLIQGVLVGSVADPHHKGWITGLVVNTGLLPAQFHVVKGQVLSHLAPSQLHLISGPPTTRGYTVIHEWVSLTWWGWSVLGAAILYPLGEFLLHRVRIVRREARLVPVEVVIAVAI